MTLQELLTEAVETPSIECWDDESTASVLRALAVRLHSAGISYRETAAALESTGIKRSHQAVYQWTHRVGEKAPSVGDDSSVVSFVVKSGGFTFVPPYANTEPAPTTPRVLRTVRRDGSNTLIAFGGRPFTYFGHPDTFTVDDIIDKTHPFPTYSEAFKHACQAFWRDTETMSCCVE